MLGVLSLGAVRGTTVTLETDDDSPDAEATIASLVDLLTETSTPNRMTMADRLQGVGVGTGIAIGPLYKMGRPPELPAAMPVDDDETEAQAAATALETVSADLAARIPRSHRQHVIGGARRAQHDRRRPDSARAGRRAHPIANDAPHAVYKAFEGYRELLSEAGGYLAERAADLGDIRDPVIAVLLGLPMPGLPDPGLPYVLAADDLAAYLVQSSVPPPRGTCRRAPSAAPLRDLGVAPVRDERAHAAGRVVRPACGRSHEQLGVRPHERHGHRDSACGRGSPRPGRRRTSSDEKM